MNKSFKVVEKFKYFQMAQMLSYRKHMTNLHFIPQSSRKERIEKKKPMSIKHTAITSINYTTEVTGF
jgi:hypothetical protein